MTERIGLETIFIPFHFGKTDNLLTNPVLDPDSKIPGLKVCAVKLRKPKCGCVKGG
ncbi:hypothetical protein ACFL0D_04390 [Thermoproteota archaeon]